MYKKRSLVVLIVVNLIPVFGVLFWYWSLYQILFVFWLENIVIGFYNVLKMNRLAKYQRALPTSQAVARDTVIQRNFFILHFGAFTAGHGLFMNLLFFDGSLKLWGVIMIVCGLFVSHGLSYKNNFINKQEYKNLDAQKLFLAPYARVFAMHFTILVGGWLILYLGQPTGSLFVLVLLKTVIDCWRHIKEHKKLSVLT